MKLLSRRLARARRELDARASSAQMKLSLKRGARYYTVYSDVVGMVPMGFIRRRLRFDLFRTCVIALRGFKKNAAPEKIWKIEDLEFNLRSV